MAGGAAGGVVASGPSGKVGQGMLIGAVTGGVAGAVGLFGITDAYLEGLAQIATGAAVGGVTSELTGGKFSQGAFMGAGAAVVAWGLSRAMTGRESQQVAEGSMCVAYDPGPTYLERAMKNSVQIALGPFGPGFTNILPTDPYAIDYNSISIDLSVQWMMSPVRGARPGVFAGGGLQGLYGGYETGKLLYRGLGPILKIPQGFPLPIVPNPNIFNPPIPQALPGSMRIR